jgi:hypothetical protein
MRRVADTKGLMAGVATPDEYRKRMHAFLAKQGVRPPKDASVTGAVGLLEPDGFVRLKCACGNYPIVDPVWQLACCFGCGGVFERVAVPTGEGA